MELGYKPGAAQHQFMQAGRGGRLMELGVHAGEWSAVLCKNTK
jgi:hypothetical protein